MRIKSVQSRILDVSTDKLITDAIQTIKAVEIVTCELKTNDGTSGLGFTYTIGAGGEAIKSVIDTIFSKLLRDSNPEAIGDVWEKMWRITHAVGRGGITTHAMAAVDIALWDLKGKSVGKPLYSLLGGTKKSIPLYDTDGGWLHYSEDELVRAAIQVVRSHFHGFKVKVGKKNLHEDLERIKAVKDAVGKKISIMIDANQVWSADEALRRGRRFQDLDVEWYEEPVVADDIWGCRRVTQNLDVPVATGETMFSKYEFNNCVRLEACDILQPDVCRVGGITEWMEIARMGEVNGLRISPHFVMDLHPSLVASIPNGMYVEHIPWLRKIFRKKPEIVNGSIVPSDEPGIGLELVRTSDHARRQSQPPVLGSTS